MVISNLIKEPEYFADSSNIPWNPPTIRYPDQTALVPQMSLLSLYALLFLQAHLFLICVALTYNASRRFLRKTAKFQGIVSVNDFGFPRRFQELHQGSPEKFLFCTGRTVTTGLPSLVPPRHIDDCSAIHFLH